MTNWWDADVAAAAKPTAPPPIAAPPAAAAPKPAPTGDLTGGMATLPLRLTPFGAPLNLYDTIRNHRSEGAPLHVRAAVGSAADENRQAVLSKFYPNNVEMPSGNFSYVDPADPPGKMRWYNPPGLELGDVMSLPAEFAEVVGGVTGGVAGAPFGGPVGAIIGGATGATAAREGVQDAVMALTGVDDARTDRERALDTATTFGLNALIPGGAAAVSALGKSAVRGAFRGSARGRAGVQSAVDDLGRFGASPSVAQATQNPMADATESFLSRYPGSAGLIRRRARETAEQVAKGLDDRLSTAPALRGPPSGRVVDRGFEPDVVGRGIASDVSEFANRQFMDNAERYYGRLNRHIPPDAPVPVTQTDAYLHNLITPAVGAPQTSEILTNPTIKQVAAAFRADAANGTLPYTTLRDLRSMVGRRIANRSLHDDIPIGELRGLYKAISRDLREEATQRGPAALRAFNRADTFYRAGINRIEEVLQPLVDKNVPEKIFFALERAGKEGPTMLWRVRHSVSPEQWRVMSSLIAKRLGRAPAGSQDELGETFSFQTFLTNWNKLDPKARNALFDGQGTLRADLDALARATARMRESSKAFFNTSGTAQATMLQNVIGLSGAGLAAAPFTGFSLYLPVTIAMGSLAANRSARLMTNPAFVHWLAQGTRIAPNGVNAHIGRLTAAVADADPDTREAARALAGQMGLVMDTMRRPRGLPSGAQRGDDGKYYVPDPKRRGAYLEVQPVQ